MPLAAHDSGLLSAGDGHHVHWEAWGTEAGIPVVLVHGGRGGGCSPRHRDPVRWERNGL